jgi:hypothetical protein
MWFTESNGIKCICGMGARLWNELTFALRIASRNARLKTGKTISMAAV